MLLPKPSFLLLLFELCIWKVFLFSLSPRAGFFVFVHRMISMKALNQFKIKEAVDSISRELFFLDFMLLWCQTSCVLKLSQKTIIISGTVWRKRKKCYLKSGGFSGNWGSVMKTPFIAAALSGDLKRLAVEEEYINMNVAGSKEMRCTVRVP